MDWWLNYYLIMKFYRVINIPVKQLMRRIDWYYQKDQLSNIWMMDRP